MGGAHPIYREQRFFYRPQDLAISTASLCCGRRWVVLINDACALVVRPKPPILNRTETSTSETEPSVELERTSPGVYTSTSGAPTAPVSLLNRSATASPLDLAGLPPIVQERWMTSSNAQPLSAAHLPSTLTPPTRPTRPRLSRGISSRKLAPPPVPPSLRDHPLLDVVAHSSSSSSSGLGASSSSGTSSVTSPGSVPSSRRSSVSASSPVGRPTDKLYPLPLPSPTNLWSRPAHPSPPIGGPWNRCDAEPIKDTMDLFDTVPAGSSVSVASPNGYPWHTAPGTTTTGYAREFVSKQPNLHLPRRQALTPQSHPHENIRSPGSVNPQRHNVGTLHTHSPQPSPPVTPAAA
ncbi:hypothetical protein OPQ81_006641 [Rhizoctonia solani]|nr:hypothetical protein OPQ81_006641 [Rhizoctonia solani]